MSDLNPIANFNSFRSYLNSLRDQHGELTLNDLKQAKSIAESLSAEKEIPHALEYLKSESSGYGSKEAKLFFSIGSRLSLEILTAGISADEQLLFLKELFTGTDEIEVTAAINFPFEKKQKLEELVSEAAGFYKNSAKGNRAGISQEELKYRELNNFMTYLRESD
jgi:hypothetical protein